MRKMTVLLFCVGFLAAGCAHYGAKGVVPTLSDESKLIKMEKEGVKITILPITSEADAKKYFGENILDKKVIAVYADICNTAAESVKIEGISLILSQSENISLPSLKPEEAYKILKKGWFVKSAFWWFAGSLVFPAVGGPISALHTSSVNKKIKEDVKGKMLASGEIKPNESIRGFVWFRIPKAVASASEDDGKNDNKILPKGTLKLIISFGGDNPKLVEYNLAI